MQLVRRLIQTGLVAGAAVFSVGDVQAQSPSDTRYYSTTTDGTVVPVTEPSTSRREGGNYSTPIATDQGFLSQLAGKAFCQSEDAQICFQFRQIRPGDVQMTDWSRQRHKIIRRMEIAWDPGAGRWGGNGGQVIANFPADLGVYKPGEYELRYFFDKEGNMGFTIWNYRPDAKYKQVDIIAHPVSFSVSEQELADLTRVQSQTQPSLPDKQVTAGADPGGAASSGSFEPLRGDR